MGNEIVRIAQASPEILIFLSLGIGYFAGKIKIRGFGLGTTASVLLAAMILGQIPIDIPPLLKNVSFALFAFCIGYQVGPQFFGALRKEGLNYLWISLVVALAGLAASVILGKALHFDQGTAAGLFAGAMTQSAAIGTAAGALDHLSLSAAEKTVLNNNMAVAFAITYLFGTIGVIVLFKLVPKVIGLDLKKSSADLERSMGGETESAGGADLFALSRAVSLRVYKAEKEAIAGRTVQEIEKIFLPARIDVEKIKRAGVEMCVDLNTVIRAGDIVALVGRRPGFIRAGDLIGPEVDVTELSDMMGEVLDICVLNPKVAGKTLAELARTMAEEAHGLFLTRVTRQGRRLPITADLVINKCDVLQIVGEQSYVERAAAILGYPERPSNATDLVMVGCGCVLGSLLGILAITVAGVPLTLGMGGGVLISGLFFGWLRSVHPTFGRIPEGGQWLLTDLGLNLFIACVGLGSARSAVAALHTNGLPIFLAGVAVAILPIIVGLWFGRWLLKMNPVLLLGALTGARVIPPALTALEEDAGSQVLTIGFAAPFAFANVFLTIMGSIIINLM